MSTYTFPNAGGLKLNKDHITLMTAADCAPGAEGGFTTDVELALVAQYTTNFYSVHVNECGGTEVSGAVFKGFPIDQFKFRVTFLNLSGAMIPANTPITVSFDTLGI